MPTAEFRQAVLRRADEDELEGVARRAGWRTIREAADAAAAAGVTTAQEVERVLGPRA